MSIEQTYEIDFANIDNDTGNFLLTIVDHLPWGKNEHEHMALAQDKLNAYLAFIESGEIFTTFPEAKDRKLVINFVGKFSPTPHGQAFLDNAREIIKSSGIEFRFEIFQPN